MIIYVLNNIHLSKKNNNKVVRDGENIRKNEGEPVPDVMKEDQRPTE
jgi:hypothetical protein